MDGCVEGCGISVRSGDGRLSVKCASPWRMSEVREEGGVWECCQCEHLSRYPLVALIRHCPSLYPLFLLTLRPPDSHLVKALAHKSM